MKNKIMSIPSNFLGTVLLVACVAIGTVFNSTDLRAAKKIHDYTVSIDVELEKMTVRACFDGLPPEELIASSMDAPLALVKAVVEDDGSLIKPSGSLKLKGLPSNGCLSYQVDVSRPYMQHDLTGEKVRRVGKHLVLDNGIWLWRPAIFGKDETIEISFALPEGINVATPWSVVPAIEAELQTFRLDNSPSDWPAVTVFGDFENKVIDFHNTKLSIVLLDGEPSLSLPVFDKWVLDSALAARSVYGRLPFDRAQIVVEPNAHGRRAVPWAYLLRGGGPSLYVAVNQRRPVRELLGDTTVIHEFVHLIMPYIHPDDAWCREGFATYYETILPARMGRISPDYAWKLLHRGFEKGRRQIMDMTLFEASRKMYTVNTRDWVYWGGAAIIFLADLELRKRSQGKVNMDIVLRLFSDCCMNDKPMWRANDLFVKFDELTGFNVFSEIYNNNLENVKFPELEEVYLQLGLSRNTGELKPDVGESAERLRKGIMSRSPANL